MESHINTWSVELGGLEISSLIKSYQIGTHSPTQVLAAILNRIEVRGADGVWTYLRPEQEVLRQAAQLEQMHLDKRATLPLWGIPFSVKDCIDVEGTPTSCGCPAFTYMAQHTNPGVQQLLNAGAILIGKTNLDQFATGLVGTRTGFDIPHNPFAHGYIAGGSSSGAAVSVAVGLVSFAIGTDTGGSGRVPAGFNNIVGLKPTRGLLSTAHTVHACRTIDCLSIFALTAEDAWTVMQVAKGYDPVNPYSRAEVSPITGWMNYKPEQPFRFGVPASGQRQFFGNLDVEAQFNRALATLSTLGGTYVEIDYTPFMETNQILFQGPWIAERYRSVGSFIEDNPTKVLPITRQIILAAKELTAVDVFEGLYRLAELKQKTDRLWNQMDVLVVPTAGTAYRIAEIAANPIELNANLGYYTNFVNLLDLAAIAIPNGFQQNGIPTGVTFITPPFTERYLSQIGSWFHQHVV